MLINLRQLIKLLEVKIFSISFDTQSIIKRY